MTLMEQILSPRNLLRAVEKVRANKGTSGVDGVKVTDLALYPTFFESRKKGVILCRRTTKLHHTSP